MSQNTLKNDILKLLQDNQYCVADLTKIFKNADNSNYFDLILKIIPDILENLLQEHKIYCSKIERFSCGPGNGDAIERFYKGV